MPKDRSTKSLVASSKKRDTADREAVLDDLFQDMYRNRRRVYSMNFKRGLFFGLGSAIGSTFILALVVWVLSWFVDFPVVGEWLNSIKDSISTQ